MPTDQELDALDALIHGGAAPPGEPPLPPTPKRSFAPLPVPAPAPPLAGQAQANRSGAGFGQPGVNPAEGAATLWEGAVALWHVPAGMVDLAVPYYSGIPELARQAVNPNIPPIPAAQRAAEAIVPQEEASRDWLAAAHRGALNVVLPLGTDPMNAVLGMTLAAPGESGQLLSKVAAPIFAFLMGKGTIEAANQAIELGMKQGWTPEVLQHSVEALGQAGLGAAPYAAPHVAKLLGGKAAHEAAGGPGAERGRNEGRAIAPDAPIPPEAEITAPRPEEVPLEDLHARVDAAMEHLDAGGSLTLEASDHLQAALAELQRRGEEPSLPPYELAPGEETSALRQLGWTDEQLASKTPAEARAALEAHAHKPAAAPAPPEAGWEGAMARLDEMLGAEATAGAPPEAPAAASRVELSPEQAAAARDIAKAVHQQDAPSPTLAELTAQHGPAAASEMLTRIHELTSGHFYYDARTKGKIPPPDLASTPADYTSPEGVPQWFRRLDREGNPLPAEAPSAEGQVVVTWAQDPTTGELIPAGSITNLRGEQHYLNHARSLGLSDLPTSFKKLQDYADSFGWREAPEETSSGMAQKGYIDRKEAAGRAGEAAATPAAAGMEVGDAKAGLAGSGEVAEPGGAPPRAGGRGGGGADREGGGSPQAAGPASSEPPAAGETRAPGGSAQPPTPPPDGAEGAGGGGAAPAGSPAGGPAGGKAGGFSLPEHTFPDRVATALQDSLRRVERVEKSVVAQGGTFRNLMAHLGGVRAKGSAAQTEVMNRYVAPLLKSLDAGKIDLADLDAYLQVLHKPTRDLEGAARGADPTTPASGISAQEAIAHWSRLEQRYGPLDPATHRIAALEPAAQRVRDLLTHNLDTAQAGGLLSPEQVANLRKTWGDDYVPLRNFEAEDGVESHPGLGTGTSGFSVHGKEYQAATGRYSQADSPTAFSVKQALRTVERAERNKAAQQLGAWLIENGLAKPDPAHTQHVLNSSGERIQAVDHKAMMGDFAYKVDGVTRRLDLQSLDPNLAKAVQSMGAKELQGVFGAMGKLTRRFSKLATNTASFLFTNPMRDIPEALINTGVEQGGGSAAAALGKLRTSARDLWAYQRDPAAAAAGAAGSLVKEFYEDGGAVGWSQQQSAREIEKSILGHLKTTGPGFAAATSRAYRGVVEGVEHANKVLENATRFSVYQALREKGVPRLEAGHYARNVTLDFTKHGTAGPLLSSLYAFSNANIQGLKRLKEVAIDSPRGRRATLGIMAAGASLDAYNRMMSGDSDKDGISDYDSIPEYVKSKNFIFVRPEALGGGPGAAVVMLPLPYGFGIFYSLGRQASAAMAGELSPTKAAIGAVTNIASAFNPLGAGASLVQVISPTVLRPFVEHSANLDFTGKPLVPEPPMYKHPQPPPSEQAYKNSPPFAKAVAKEANSLSGGDEITPGWASVSPELISHYTAAANSYLTGGLGKEALEITQAVASALRSEPPALRTIPVVRRFAYSVTDNQEVTTSKLYRENLDELRELAARRNAYYKKGNLKRAAEIPEALILAYLRVHRIDQDLQKLRALEEKTGADLGDLITQKQTEANKIVLEARRGKHASTPPEATTSEEPPLPPPGIGGADEPAGSFDR